MRTIKIIAFLGLFAAFVAPWSATNASGPGAGMPRYDHIFVIVEENHSFKQIIGNPNAPIINKLAQKFGLATQYFGVTHPSEPNYVAMIGGSYYGIQDDNPYYTHTIFKPSLADQLEGAKLTWKGYFQSMPFAGYRGVCYPSCKKNDPLYASKHNGFMNFDHVQDNRQELLKLVPMPQFEKDLQGGQVANFSFVVPDQCHDMHGATPYCVNNTKLISQADAYAGKLYTEITNSSAWSQGNNAIVIVWDEGTDNAGCCDSNPGGGQVPAIVITNHSTHSVRDSTPYNHYSLLLTIEQAFGLGCLQYTCDTKNVTPMTKLFANS